MHPTSAPSPRVSPTPRLAALPPNHHLWRNGGRWWIAIVLVQADGRRTRLRRSLGTGDVVAARAHRDLLLGRVATSKHWRPAHGALAAVAEATHGEAA